MTEDSHNDRYKRMVKRLLIINNISLTMQGSLELDKLLHIMLSGITAGESLGFNRALLFLVDEKRENLRGEMAVGSLNWEECSHIWQNILEEDLTLDDFIRSFGEVHGYQKAEINLRIKELSIPLKEEGGIIALTALEKKHYHIIDAKGDSRVNPMIKCLLDSNEFATLPLITKNKVLGVILVDNKFSGRPISEDDMRLLSIISGQAAVAMENTKLYSQIDQLNQTLTEKIFEATEELQRTHKELVRKEKLALLGEMAAIVAHEIRNPLTSVRGFSQRIARKAHIESIREYGKIIIDEVDRLDKVLTNVLEYARRLDPNIKPNSIKKLIDEVVTLSEEQGNSERIKIECLYDPDIDTIYVDNEQIKQVLLNLVLNAIQASPPESTIRISTQKEGYNGIIRIKDSGEGIHPKLLENIFSPFFTTKTHGTGLGLSMAQRIVEDHKGKIEVEETSPHGTTFKVTLPIENRI